MTDEIIEPVLVAIALTRGHLMTMRGQKSTKATLEADQLELAAHEDLLAVIQALANVSAIAVVTATAASAQLGSTQTPESFLDAVEAQLRGDAS